MRRQSDASSMLSVGITTPSACKRPKSAGIFPSANRKLIAATSVDSSPRAQISIANQSTGLQQRPQSGRYRPPPSNSGSTSLRPRPCIAAMQLWKQPGHLAATHHKAIVQRVVREEINEQRHVTLEAQRQLHELQTAIARRQEEFDLAQRHLHAFDSLSSSVRPGALASVSENSPQTSKVQQPSSHIFSNLKEEIAHQEAYKKRLRFMHERLVQQIRYLEANADLLAERRRAAHRERTLCRNRVLIESNKNRETQQQLRVLHVERDAFKRNTLPVLESYRDELASRLVINQRRHDADRRRDELLRFIRSRSLGGSKVTNKRSLSSATAAIMKDRIPVSRVQRRESYNILAADADENERETLFAVYEGQYARVLRETGEMDLAVVLDRFQSHRESTVRLREIEAELRVEGARLTREQQTHIAMVSRLRVSGPTDIVERRQRLRDRLEGALHAQQLEKHQVRERVDAQLKAFVYVQQGVLHIVELLQCLETGPAFISPPSVLSTARTVMGGSQPAELALKNVAPALQTLAHLARDVGRRGLQREWSRLPALRYSMPQVARLEQFAPEGQVQRGSFASFEDEIEAKQETSSSGLKMIKWSEGEIDEEEQDATDMRNDIKKQEKETLRQAEAILRQANEAKKLQQVQQVQQPQQLQQRKLSFLKQQLSDTEIVAAHFREQRRLEKHEHRYMNGTVQPVGQGRSTSFNSVNVLLATQSPKRRLPN